MAGVVSPSVGRGATDRPCRASTSARAAHASARASWRRASCSTISRTSACFWASSALCGSRIRSANGPYPSGNAAEASGTGEGAGSPAAAAVEGDCGGAARHPTRPQQSSVAHVKRAVKAKFAGVTRTRFATGHQNSLATAARKIRIFLQTLSTNPWMSAFTMVYYAHPVPTARIAAGKNYSQPYDSARQLNEESLDARRSTRQRTPLSRPFLCWI